MFFAGLDLSRKRLNVDVVEVSGASVLETAVPPDADGLRGLVERLDAFGAVRAAIESMNGARFVHDRLERSAGTSRSQTRKRSRDWRRWHPRATASTRRCWPSWAGAIWCRRSGCPTRPSGPSASASGHAGGCIWSAIGFSSTGFHATLVAFGTPCPVSDLFGARGRQLLDGLSVPDPWCSDVLAAVTLIDDLDRAIDGCQRELRRLGADHRYVPLLMSAPGIAWVLGYTIAAEIGDIDRFASPRKPRGYTGLCPGVYQSGARDVRGPLARNGPKLLRWALIEAATHAARMTPPTTITTSAPPSAWASSAPPRSLASRSPRRLAEAIWHMLTHNQPFAPAGPTRSALAA